MPEQLPHPVTGRSYASPVPAGHGWPDDPAGRRTPVATSAEQVEQLAETDDVDTLSARMSVCRACPRLVEWRESVARDKRKSFDGQPYWGRPVPGWGAGASDAQVVVLGLAPAAHGGNRTGRIFTGDRSGDWLFASMHRTGLAAQQTSEHAGDGQALIGARVLAAVRCAPPDNKPSNEERDTCAPWLVRELELLSSSMRVVVCLGSYAWLAALRTLRSLGYVVPRPRPAFSHGAEASLWNEAGESIALIGSYHPSQQNTFTGKLTTDMLDGVFSRAHDLVR